MFNEDRLEDKFQNVGKETKQWKAQSYLKIVETTLSRSNMRLTVRPGR